MVEALTRLDLTDALVEKILGDRAKLEHSFNRVHEHTCHSAQQQPSSSATSEEVGPIDYPIHTTETESESELDWDPECVDDDGYLLVDENGSTLVPVPRDGPLDEPEASSLSAWAQCYREIRMNLRDSNTGADITNLGHRVLARKCEKHCLRRDNLDDIETYALCSERERKNTALSVSQEPK